MSRESLLEELAVLGSTRGQIAKFLQAQGVQGKIGISDQCPVANYLKRKHNKASVGSMVLTWEAPSDLDECVSTPASIKDFINAFDAGQYPELIEDD
jgi:hypothetical protein